MIPTLAGHSDRFLLSNLLRREARVPRKKEIGKRSIELELPELSAPVAH